MLMHDLFCAEQGILNTAVLTDCAGRAVTDEEILSSVLKEMSSFSVQVAAEAKSSKPLPCTEALTLVETAGGVASPAPSGDLQVGVEKVLMACIFVDGELVVQSSCPKHAGLLQLTCAPLLAPHVAPVV